MSEESTFENQTGDVGESDQESNVGTEEQSKKGFLQYFTGQWSKPGGFVAAVVMTWGVQLLYGFSSQPDWKSGLRAFSVIWFAGGAAFFVGSFFGFLFGVPKLKPTQSSQIKSESEPEEDLEEGAIQESSSSQGTLLDENTNLQEVSDWLTKIIIGIGLAEFRAIAEWIGNLGQNIGNGIGGNGSSTMAIASMVYGFVCGFLYYYLWARIIVLEILETRDWHRINPNPHNQNR